MSHLRRFLEETQALPAEQLDAVLRRQQIYGGSLDTALLELELCDAPALNRLLDEACRLPIAPAHYLVEVEDRPWSELPTDLVEVGWAIPLAEERKQLIVAVHPDLPDDRLGSLYRSIPRLRVYVTPECCIETLAAERTGSSPPQRYVILFSRYVSGLLEHTQTGTDEMFDLAERPTRRTDRYGQAQHLYSTPPSTDRLSRRLIAETTRGQRADDGPAPAAAAPPPAAVPTAPPPAVAEPKSSDRPNRRRTHPTMLGYEAVGATAPPIRFSARGTRLDRTSLNTGVDLRDLARRIELAGETLVQAESRDGALNALLAGAREVSARTALFRIRRNELVGLSTAIQTELAVDGLTFDLDDSMVHRAFAAERWWAGHSHQAGLDGLAGSHGSIPCLLGCVRVGRRPALVVYLDHAGREFVPAEANLLKHLCDVASTTFERLVRSQPKPSSQSAPSRHRATPARGVPHATETSTPRPIPLPEQPPPSHSYVPKLTWNATPPPPAVPPPPPMAEETSASSSTQRRTIYGMPDDESMPLFIPPPLDGQEDSSNIIPLASPIHQPSVRGRIAIDDDDWANDASNGSHSSTQARIDAVLKDVAQGDDIDKIRDLGVPALVRLTASFPGPLEIFRRDMHALPPPSAHGPLLRISIALGNEMTPYLVELFEHPHPHVRFYSAFVFQELRDPAVLLPLSGLAFDPDGEVRAIAMRVLETYHRSPGFARALASVREELATNNNLRLLYAIRALGTLRDVAAVPQLIDRLASRDRFIQEAALEALCSVTGQQHGLKPHRWRRWYEQKGHLHRVEWIIDSLMHRDLPVRRWATDELVRITGHRVTFSALGARDARDLAHQAWSRWWETVGRPRFAAIEAQQREELPS